MRERRPFLSSIIDNSRALPAGAVIALAWANRFPASYTAISHAMEFWVNDIAMVFFFGLAAKRGRRGDGAPGARGTRGAARVCR